MNPIAVQRAVERPGISRTSAAIRDRGLSVIVLLAVAGTAWWFTAARMAGMDAGPGTDLRGLGWFTAVWAVMMAAMMLPSLAPTAAAYPVITGWRRSSRALWFAGGYLMVWSAAGIVAYAAFQLGKHLLGHPLAWGDAGRPVAAGVLALAALYQLTPTKQACLTRCTSPWQYLPPRWRERDSGALLAGVRAGAWCLGCSWALMAALFALGVMSLAWMALVAALVMVEKLAPRQRVATIVTAVVLVALAAGVAAAPREVPGLTVPGSSAAGHMVRTMT